MKKIFISKKGFTLIEITLVLGLTLGLAAALIFGLAAFNNGADRAKCLLNIANVQKAVRSLQNLNEFRPLDKSTRVLTSANLWGDKEAFLSARPMCPRASGTAKDTDDAARSTTTGDIDSSTGYGYTGDKNTFPELGTAYIECKGKNISPAYLHVPKEVDGIRKAVGSTASGS